MISTQNQPRLAQPVSLCENLTLIRWEIFKSHRLDSAVRDLFDAGEGPSLLTDARYLQLVQGSLVLTPDVRLPEIFVVWVCWSFSLSILSLALG